MKRKLRNGQNTRNLRRKVKAGVDTQAVASPSQSEAIAQAGVDTQVASQSQSEAIALIEQVKKAVKHFDTPEVRESGCKWILLIR